MQGMLVALEATCMNVWWGQTAIVINNTLTNTMPPYLRVFWNSFACLRNATPNLIVSSKRCYLFASFNQLWTYKLTLLALKFCLKNFCCLGSCVPNANFSRLNRYILHPAKSELCYIFVFDGVAFSKIFWISTFFFSPRRGKHFFASPQNTLTTRKTSLFFAQLVSLRIMAQIHNRIN